MNALSPLEEVEKFRQLLKIGRALDEEGLEELLEQYEIIEDGCCGAYIRRGITKEKLDTLEF